MRLRFLFFVFSIFLAISGTFAGEKLNRGNIQKAYSKERELIGYKIRSIDENKQLLRVGVEPEDILQSICDVRIDSPQNFLRGDSILLKENKPCKIVLIRNGQRLTFNFEPYH